MTKFYIAIICIALCNCKARELSSDELRDFIGNEENGLIQSAEINGTKVSVAYKPTDLWVQQEMNDPTDGAAIDSLRKKYSQYYYFILSLSRSNREALHSVMPTEEYSDLVQMLSFRMSQYVNLTTTKRDTIQVGDFMLNRTYGLSNSTDIVFVFNKEKINGNQWVQFNLNEFGLGLGRQRFRFELRDLEQVPLLALKTE